MGGKTQMPPVASPSLWLVALVPFSTSAVTKPFLPLAHFNEAELWLSASGNICPPRPPGQPTPTPTSRELPFPI